ncbi:hypothetical protein GCM10010885_22360 [Alicyclobacillus cellulosilyticus]|uniref:NAD(P)/FAD-dependent oxidoreductase n=1 Tax=Alicyclobacillus cellulosilyticus TaxID=1003997 RepID=A0A917KJP6_9BACL|nr:NAD(P)/FAD-dependent oxidoreductase [Alicyclobacillus cellulosilyticus]GGJ12484.1 hypothetical protein GCM10010885_22360 [Alicyclobacillus cellulosilyticus]
MNGGHGGWDVLVVGGGPAGLMASVAARSAGARVLLLEKGAKLGRKLAISGGGRCNVTNAKPLPELMQNIPGNGRFLYSALTRFSNQDVMAFFERLGIRLKEEDHGRVFPVSDKAVTVVRALVHHVRDLGAEVRLNTPVRGLWTEPAGDGFVVRGVRVDTGVIPARAVVVATGGCSVPATGSTGDAYPWARAVGHTIVDPYPVEVPLTSDAWFIRDRALQGISLRDIALSVYDARGRRLTTEHGDLLFTHFGVSGPAALRASHYVSIALRREPGQVLRGEIDLTPAMDHEAWLETLAEARRAAPRKQLATVLARLLPDRLAAVVLRCAGEDGTMQVANLSHAAAHCVVRQIKAFVVPVTGTLPLTQATVTGGGVSVKEIDPKTMMSKKCRGLFFAGEVMDVHAHTGGYNITVAFSTGHAAGTSAAAYALSAAVRP